MEPHKIELELNSAGFSADELGTVLPDFITERKTVVGLTWYPSAEGPASYTIIVSVFLLFGAISKVFIEELAKDLYKWTKQKLLILFHKKRYPIGLIRLVFENAVVEYYCEDADTLLIAFEKLPEILNAIDTRKGDEWEIQIENDVVTVMNKAKS